MKTKGNKGIFKRGYMNPKKHCQPVITLDDIYKQNKSIIKRLGEVMTKISEFVEKQKVHNQAMSDGLDGIVGDIQALNDKITELQNTSGEVTPEDAALIDEIEAAGAALAERITSIDSLTPPPVPPVQ